MIFCFTLSFPMAQLIFNEVVSEIDFITWDLNNAFGVTMRDSIQTIDSGRFLTSSFLKLSLLHFIAVSRRCSIRHFCLPSCENCLFFKYVYLFLLFDMKHNVFNWPNILANETTSAGYNRFNIRVDGFWNNFF